MIALIFFVGACIGSVLTCIIDRLATEEETWLRGRSRCPKCRTALSARSLVPIFSWVLQRGKCRTCQEKISWTYPLIEVATGALFVLAFLERGTGNGALLLRDWYLIAILVIIFVFDLLYGLIVDSVTLPAIGILAITSLYFGMPWQTLALGVCIGAGFFAFQYAVSRGRWIGGGDIRLGALMGAALGWQRLLIALFLAYVVGAVVATVLLASRRKQWSESVPFGTFLSIGTIIALYWGDAIMHWYVASLFR
ncbi:prepilin peptidase [Patescibacteria group bacterium]|nr:prepilin peptidase [Patescibacteria group bacterium]